MCSVAPSSWVPQLLVPMEHFGASPEEATKLIRGVENLSCEKRLREFGLLSLDKKKLQRDLIATLQYLKGAYEKDRF